MPDEASLRAVAARQELAKTLDAIGDRLNVGKQLASLPDRARASWRRNPVPWIVGGSVAVVAVAGALVWALLRDD